MKSFFSFLILFFFFSNTSFSQIELPEKVKEVLKKQRAFSIGAYGAFSVPFSSVIKSSVNKSPETNTAYGLLLKYRFPKTHISINVEPGYLERKGFSNITVSKEQRIFGLGENKKLFRLYLQSMSAVQVPLSLQWNNSDIGVEFGANTSYLTGAKGKLTSQLFILNPTTSGTTAGSSTGEINEMELSNGWIDTKQFALRQWNVAFFLGAKYYFTPKASIGYRLYTDSDGVLFLPRFGFIGKHYTEWRVEASF
jgi:hypothetical protein